MTCCAAVLAKDFQTVILYDSQGQFAGVRRPGSGKPITVDGMDITIGEVIGSTGLEIKVDPGVPFVYAGERTEKKLETSVCSI